MIVGYVGRGGCDSRTRSAANRLANFKLLSANEAISFAKAQRRRQCFNGGTEIVELNLNAS